MNISEALSSGYNLLKEAQIESYIIDTQLLLSRVLNVDKLYLIMNRNEELSKEIEVKFEELLKKRKEKMPIAYILNDVEFMGLHYYVKEGVLIPRPDTEILVEECLTIIKNNQLKTICDMCCGSGAIGLAIGKHMEDTKVCLYDISDTAIEVSSRNQEILGLERRTNIIKSDLFERPLKEKMKFDMIVSNPPYIEEHIIPTLMEDVKNYEPHLALSGGPDGLEFYRRICEDGKELLNPSGYMCFEIGYNQEQETKELLRENGFIDIYSLRDLGGNFRVVIGKLP
ncbi:peptide chain release factor N(5)-glutamine methyltransferase [Clostridium culturomicium]|uniref:peptide chain release factor N(5)-glutamine methyltransferase n=1 Tax=Clostridium culturomicium TaxID=1499683 RepID=UPI0005908B63|nr:peptide chain release factor N(5)-glutamine methyltransferase [Clostridium culturomicium]